METVEERQVPPKIRPKRRKPQEIVKKREDEDRISTLPDCLLLEILSHLPSTKSAIRTGTLSKRWEHFWTLVPTLILEQNDNKQSWSDFVSMVDKTLAHCRQSKLKKFEIIYTSSCHVKPLFPPNNWVRYALRCNVEELTLTLGKWVSPNSQVDQSIFNSSSLTNLRFGYLLNPTGAISWKNLKSLYIYFTELSEKLIKNILSGSPVLETLALYDCLGFNRLDIDSKSVKNLVFTPYMNPVYDTDNGFDYETQINAPNISSLAIQGDLYFWKILLVDVSLVVEAKLDYINDVTMPKEEEEEMLKGLILKLRHVKKLTIGGSCSKVLSRLEAEGFAFPSNLKFVDDENYYNNYSDSVQGEYM